jgi:N6-adenosine-specific RNA methylase IME4
MKNPTCSWRDMEAVRQLLAATEKGDGAIYKMRKCLHRQTLHNQRLAVDVMQVLEERRSRYRDAEHFQPSHAAEIARAARRREKDPAKWTEAVKDEIARWVNRCEDEKLTVRQLRQALLAERARPQNGEPGCTVDDLGRLAESGEVFGTVYADPPWRYGNQATRAATDNHYGTMTVDEIAALPVARLAGDRAHLHLWTTNAFLPHAFRVVEAWGFEYRSLFVWCKPEMGLGNYWRVSHELLLLGVRGDCPFYDQSLRSWKEMTRRGGHSQKPEQVRHMIEKASPGPYLELFGRQAVKGWKVWGDQVSRDLFTQQLEAV